MQWLVFEKGDDTMATLTKSITIDAPVEKVFAYMDDPIRTPEFWPSMIDVRNVKQPAGGNKTFEWTYKMAGMKLDGTTEVVERVPNERLVTSGKGGIESKFTWTFLPEHGGTRLMVHVEYSVPIPVLGKLAESIIIKQNEREADTMLANLKTLMEVSEPVHNG